MDNAMLVVSLCSGISALLGSVISAFLSNRLSQYRLEQLEKRVDAKSKEIDELKGLKTDIAEIKVKLQSLCKEVK